MSTSCQYNYHCYPHVLHYNEAPDKDILAKAVAAHLAKRNNISSTSQVAAMAANNNSSSTGGTAVSEVAAMAAKDTKDIEPCAVCLKLVNGDCKCESCNRNMHVFCSVFPTTDGEGTIMRLNCTYVNAADDNVGTDTAVAKSTRKRPREKGKLGLEKEDEQPVKVSEYGELLLRCFLLFYCYFIFISFCLSLFHFILFVRLLPR